MAQPRQAEARAAKSKSESKGAAAPAEKELRAPAWSGDALPVPIGYALNLESMAHETIREFCRAHDDIPGMATLVELVDCLDSLYRYQAAFGIPAPDRFKRVLLDDAEDNAARTVRALSALGAVWQGAGSVSYPEEHYTALRRAAELAAPAMLAGFPPNHPI